MQNIQYIVDAVGNKTGVVLSVDDYEKILEEKTSEYAIKNKTSDFEHIQKFLNRQLTLSLLDKVFAFLEVPVDNSGRRTRDSSLMLFALVEYFYYSKDHNISGKDYTVRLKDKDFSKFLVSIESKTIQTQRNDNLIPYLKKTKKSVVEIYQYEPSSKKGTSYKLNFLEVLEKSVSEFFHRTKLEFKEIIELIEFSKGIRINEIDKANKKFKDLWETVTFNLDKLPNEPKIHQSEATLASKNRLLEKY